MENLKCVIFEEIPDINSFDDEELFYDMYWQQILKYQLIFIPQNTIIFWGFKVKLSKNEYDLLKSVISLKSKTNSADGYTETQIIKPINYHRVNTDKPKNKSFQRFIINRASSLKSKITNAIFEKVLERIRNDNFNPFFHNGQKRTVVDIDVLRQDVKFKTKVIKSKLNLVYFHSELMGYINRNALPYADFQITKAIRSLIYPVQGQKHGSLHRRFNTDYSFNIEKKIFVKKKYRADKGKKRKKLFNVVTHKPKFNCKNYVN